MAGWAAVEGTVRVVPEISRFFGIVIAIFYRDHEPPHFHASYGDSSATVEIASGTVRGDLPSRALRLIQEWRELYQDQLLENWRLARERQALQPIPPLE